MRVSGQDNKTRPPALLDGFSVILDDARDLHNI